MGLLYKKQGSGLVGGVLQSPHNSISRSGDWVPLVQAEPIGNMALLAARTYDPGSLYY